MEATSKVNSRDSSMQDEEEEDEEESVMMNVIYPELAEIQVQFNRTLKMLAKSMARSDMTRTIVTRHGGFSFGTERSCKRQNRSRYYPEQDEEEEKGDRSNDGNYFYRERLQESEETRLKVYQMIKLSYSAYSPTPH
jgi:hypothetical protein